MLVVIISAIGTTCLWFQPSHIQYVHTFAHNAKTHRASRQCGNKFPKTLGLYDLQSDKNTKLCHKQRARNQFITCCVWLVATWLRSSLSHTHTQSSKVEPQIRQHPRGNRQAHKKWNKNKMNALPRHAESSCEVNYINGCCMETDHKSI